MRLEAVDVSFGYPGHPVGRGASLVVGPGEVVCLLGPNGCGKSTFFKTLLGLIPAEGGRVLLGGEVLGALSRAEIARRVSYVAQTQSVPFPYGALDVVLMGRMAHRGLFAQPTAEDRRLAAAALDELGIASLAGRDVTRLSGGQRQLVAIARATAQAAPLIVMDEPTASLDFGNQSRVLAEVRRLAGRGAGIVLSTHDPGHAFAVATRVALMREGRIVADGEPGAVMTAEALGQVYGIAVAVERLSDGRRVCVPALPAR